jgi:hypothetical protein
MADFCLLDPSLGFLSQAVKAGRPKGAVGFFEELEEEIVPSKNIAFLITQPPPQVSRTSANSAFCKTFMLE